MKHCIPSRTEVLMMASSGGRWNVWRLKTTWLLAHIVFFVGKSVAGIWPTHNRRWGGTDPWVLRWMLLVAFQGKGTERSNIWNAFILVGEVLVTVGTAGRLTSRLVLLDLSRRYMLTKSTNSRMHGNLTSCSTVSVERWKGQATPTASRMHLWREHS